MPLLDLKRTGRAFGACLVVALLLAACGGGDDDDAQPDTTTAGSETPAPGNTDATAPTDEPVDTADNSDGNTTDLVDNGSGVACSLVTTDQVSAATGTAMKDGVGQGGVDAAYSNCRWDAQTGTATLSLDFFKQGAQTYYTEGSDNEGKTAVPGIGEKARWSTLLSQFEVVQGGDYFAVYVHTASNENNQAAATTVATIVLQSLS